MNIEGGQGGGGYLFLPVIDRIVNKGDIDIPHCLTLFLMIL
jgi:hypothetical protein